MGLSDNRTLTIGMVAGENSGDQLAAAFMRAWLARYPNTKFVGIGGPCMQALGFESIYSIDELNVMGVVEPLKRLPRLITIYRGLRRYFLKHQPDCFIGIDFKEFNLLLAAALKKHGLKTVQYVGPTVWAWRPNRIHRVKRAVNKILLLFPFELPIYETHGIDACCVGHPFADEIPFEIDQAAARRRLDVKEDGPILALLPGSRRQEIEALGRPFAEAALLLKDKIKGLTIITAGADEKKSQRLRAIFEQASPEQSIQIFTGKTRDVLAASDVVLCASGTATLEVMLHRRPMVVAYKVGKWTYYLAKKLVKTKYIALPNILAGKPLVSEFLQEKVEKQTLADALMPLFEKNDQTVKMIEEFSLMHKMLKKDASATAAQAVETLLKKG